MSDDKKVSRKVRDWRLNFERKIDRIISSREFAINKTPTMPVKNKSCDISWKPEVWWAWGGAFHCWSRFERVDEWISVESRVSTFFVVYTQPRPGPNHCQLAYNLHVWLSFSIIFAGIWAHQLEGPRTGQRRRPVQNQETHSVEEAYERLLR